MKLKYHQENQLFELVGGSSKSKASTFVVLVVVVVVAAACLELRSPNFQSNFKGFWRYLEVYLQIFKISATFHEIQARNSPLRNSVCWPSFYALSSSSLSCSNPDY